MTQIMDMFSHFFCFENFQSNLSKKQHNPYLPSYDRQSFGMKRQGKRELPRITATASSNMICCWVHKPALWITTLFSVVSCITDIRLWVHKPDYRGKRELTTNIRDSSQ